MWQVREDRYSEIRTAETAKTKKSRCPTSVARPQLTNAAKPATYDVEAYNERGEMVPTAIAGEHPLTLYLDKREIVTLMTLGHAPEALVIGYLRNQRLVDSIDDIAVGAGGLGNGFGCAVTTLRQKKIDLRRRRPSPRAAARARCSAT